MHVGNFTDKVMEPTVVDLDKKFKSIAAGVSHYAAIDETGLVYTWGQGGFGNTWFTKAGGQLGHDNTESVSLPKKVLSFEEYCAKAVSVQCGDKHTLILPEDGEVLTLEDLHQKYAGDYDKDQIEDYWRLQCKKWA